MDDAERIRIARSARVDRTPPGSPDGGGSPAMVAQVTSGQTSIGVGKYFNATPMLVSGMEAENVPGIVSRASPAPTTILLLGPGLVVTGDNVIARHEGNRWVTHIGKGRNGTIGTVATIPGCFCTAIPTTLTMTSADPECNYQMFQSCVLQWQPTPAWAATLSLGPSIFLSTESFPDPIAGGARFYYYLICHLNQFSLTRIYPTSPYGSPYRDALLYTWLLGGYGNTCDPFHLDNGTAFPGSDLTCSVSIDA